MHDNVAMILRDALVEGRTVSVEYLGQFSVRERPPRREHPAVHGDVVVSPSSRVVKFQPSNRLKSYLLAETPTTSQEPSEIEIDLTDSALVMLISDRLQYSPEQAEDLLRTWL